MFADANACFCLPSVAKRKNEGNCFLFFILPNILILFRTLARKKEQKGKKEGQRGISNSYGRVQKPL